MKVVGNKADMNTSKRIAFLGLGAMGEPMAERLLDAGFIVTSCANRSRDAIERLAAKGLIECASAGEAAKEADVFISIVFDEEQNNRVLRGDSGALAALNPGSTIVLMSTISPSYCQEIATEAGKKGVNVLDCPVSGMVEGAVAGTLTLMVGGDEGVIAQTADVFSVMGSAVRCGDVGAGQLTKVANNTLFISTFALLQELREVIESYGMDFKQFIEVLNQSTGRSWVSENVGIPRQRVALPEMPVKDVGIGRDLAGQLGIDVPLIKQILEHGK